MHARQAFFARQFVKKKKKPTHAVLQFAIVVLVVKYYSYKYSLNKKYTDFTVFTKSSFMQTKIDP